VIKWEYEVRRLTSLSQFPENMQSSLNAMGRLGWELVQVYEISQGRVVAVFKRPVELS